DTITEDLDLSYRAQLAGWRFRYEHHVIAPAELPESWAAFRSQQARWVRGSVETAGLLLPTVLRARQLNFRQRSEALIHLTNNFAYLFMAALAVLLPAAVVLRDQLGWRVPGGQVLLSGFDVTMLIAGTLAMIVFYGVAAARCRAGWRILDLLYALCLGCGMSIANAIEVIRGLRSRRSEFVRTPKRGTATGTKALTTYRSPIKIDLLAIELFMTLYYAAAAAYALYFSLWGALPFMVMYLIGFGSVAVATVFESAIRSRRTIEVATDGLPSERQLS
ncbi:MAG: glycosyltransferase family 2 protein, partial [Myxococcota bacterium]